MIPTLADELVKAVDDLAALDAATARATARRNALIVRLLADGYANRAVAHLAKVPTSAVVQIQNAARR